MSSRGAVCSGTPRGQKAKNGWCLFPVPMHFESTSATCVFESHSCPASEPRQPAKASIPSAPGTQLMSHMLSPTTKQCPIISDTGSRLHGKRPPLPRHLPSIEASTRPRLRRPRSRKKIQLSRGGTTVGQQFFQLSRGTTTVARFLFDR